MDERALSREKRKIGNYDLVEAVGIEPSQAESQLCCGTSLYPIWVCHFTRSANNTNQLLNKNEI